MCITNLDSNLDDGWNGYGNYYKLGFQQLQNFEV